MDIFILAIAVFLLFEGTVYALFPEQTKRMLATIILWIQIISGFWTCHGNFGRNNNMVGLKNIILTKSISK